MNLEEVKEALYDMTSMFFQGAAVIWTEQTGTKPGLPYLTLKMGSLQRSAFPLVGEDGNRYYPCRTTAEFNLYTRGRPVTAGDNVTGNYANTAVSDLMSFFQFVESDAVTDRMAEKGIEVTLIPPVRDLTALQNDSGYRYRSMAEATVTFAQEADGLYGLGGMPAVPSFSGGGTKSMAARAIDALEGAEISEAREGGMSDNEK